MKSKNNLILWGSILAKAGFSNEEDIALKFNNWQKDSDSQLWLELMGYKLSEINGVNAVRLNGYKTDVQVQITSNLNDVSLENISIKLVSNTSGFNQIDKRWISNYVKLWNIPDEVTLILQKYTGEIKSDVIGLRDPRRMYFDEMEQGERERLVSFFVENKDLILSDILKGSGDFAAKWMLVAVRVDNEVKWILKTMDYAIGIFSLGDICITKQGNLKIGKVSMQRKGGDSGRDTAKMLQFKVNPLLLVDSEGLDNNFL